MGLTKEWEFWFIGVPTILFGSYVLIWAIPGTICGVILALGNSKRMIWIDNQLSKDAKKLHSNDQSMMPYSITSRFMRYCLTYPFISHRITTTSTKFRVFMWINTLGFWSFLSVSFLVFIAKAIKIIP